MKNVKFIFEGSNIVIPCKNEEKFRVICDRFATKINKNTNNLIFLYNGSKIDINLKYNEIINQIDKKRNEISILVYENEDEYAIKCNKCGEFIKYDNKIVKYLLLSNKNEKDIIIGIKEMILNIVNNNKDNIINQLKNIVIILDNLIFQINQSKNEIEKLNNYNVNYINSIKQSNINKIKGKKVENINSIISLNKIFDYINYERKLKIINYNKNIQNKININLENYKIYNRIYFIGEKNGKGLEFNSNGEFYEGEFKNGKRNGKGREYNNNGNLFEGEYLNGKRNGIGKEYNNNGIIFEGQYFNGKRNGKGIEYYDNHQIKYEGEYLNGKKWKGKGYDINNNIIYELKDGRGFIKEYYFGGHFEGEIFNGERNGKGKEYNYSGILKFDGKYLNGKRNGKGKEYYNNGNILFDGEYLNDKKWNGKGYDIFQNIIYELKNGKGFIKEYSSDSKLEFKGEI